MKKKSGFNLIELMATLTIIVALSILSLSAYSQHLTKERRLTAEIILNKLAISMEAYFIDAHSYQGATLEKLGFKDEIGEGFYQLSINHATLNDYILQATPLKDQAQKDKLCGTLSLHSNGEKTITGSGVVHDCW